MDKEPKTAIATSLLTILGFLVAYQVATTIRKEEALTRLRLDAVADLTKFFEEARGLIIDHALYAGYVLETVNNYNKKGHTESTVFNLRQVAAQTIDAITTRKRLAQMRVDVHTLVARHSDLISGVRAALPLLKTATESFTDITKNVWLRVPETLDERHISLYIKHIDTQSFNDYLEIYDSNYNRMSAAFGALYNLMRHELVGFNYEMWKSASDRESVRESIKLLQQNASQK